MLSCACACDRSGTPVGPIRARHARTESGAREARARVFRSLGTVGDSWILGVAPGRSRSSSTAASSVVVASGVALPAARRRARPARPVARRSRSTATSTASRSSTPRTPADLFRAQGYVHAQDRFWEMDFRRHVTAGRLSELFGADQVPTDAFLRTMGWRRVAEQEWRLLSAETQALPARVRRGRQRLDRGQRRCRRRAAPRASSTRCSG